VDGGRALSELAGEVGFRPGFDGFSEQVVATRSS